MTRARAYGIDFGTSNSALRIGRADGTFVWVKDPAAARGSWSIPSSVLLSSSGELLVGHAAERAKLVRPQNYRAEFKRDVGDDEPLMLGAEQFLPHELVARVLRFLRELAAATVDGEPEHVVITIPAAWELGNRTLMRDAAATAGFDPDRLDLVTEPVAAAAAAFAGEGEGAGTVLVYDLGGGTFDCAVARAGVDGMQVVGTPGGLPDVGGRTFDQMISAELARRFPDAMAELAGADRSDVDVVRRLLQLRGSCEEIKIQLSVAGSYPAYLPELRPAVQVELTRAELAGLLEPLLEETVTECENLLAAVDMTWVDVDRIVPVGGSARLPMVGQLLARRSGRPVLRVDDPELAVAHGAAVIADRTARLPGVAGVLRPRRKPSHAPVAARTLRHDDGVRTVAFAPDGRRLAATTGRSLRMWDLGADRVLWDAPGDVFGVAFGPDGTKLAVTPAVGGVRIYDGSGAVVRELGIDTAEPLWGVAFSASGRHVAAAGRRSRVFNLESGAALDAQWHSPSTRFRSVVFSPDGRLLAAGSEDGAIRLKRPGVAAEPLTGHAGAVRQVAFSPDGTRLASAGRDGTVLVQDIGAGPSDLLRLSPGGRATAAAFAPDGTMVAAGSSEGVAVVWDARSGAELGRVTHAAAVTSVAFSPDGRLLASGASDGAVRLTPDPGRGPDGAAPGSPPAAWRAASATSNT